MKTMIDKKMINSIIEELTNIRFGINDLIEELEETTNCEELYTADYFIYNAIFDLKYFIKVGEKQ